MGAYVFQNAIVEYLRPKRIVVWLLVAFALYLAGKLFVGTRIANNPQDTYAMLSTLLLFRLLPLASAIFSTAVLSQEVEQKTVVYLLTRPIPRPVFLLMRTLASALAVMLVTGFAAVALSFAVYGSPTNALLFRDLKAIAVGALAYGTLFVLISLIVNRSMIVTLLFAFAWETSIPSMPGSVYLLSISSYLTAIAQRPSTGKLNDDMPLGSLANVLGTNTMLPNVGWMAMIGLIVFCAALGAWWFSQNEYLPREDAE